MSTTPAHSEIGNERTMPDDHVLQGLAMTVVDVDGAEWAVRMDVTPKVVNGGGALQGGLLATLIDIVAGTALLKGPEPYDQTSTMDMHVTYHAGARIGPVLATGHVLRRGGRTASVRVEVVDLGANGLHVATGMLTFAARRLPPEESHKASAGWLMGIDGRSSIQ